MMTTTEIPGGFIVPLGCGQWKKLEPKGFAIIDESNKEKVLRFRWSLSDQGYAYRTFRDSEGRLRHQKMQHLLLTRHKDMFLDHINGNRLDNRECNLRVCTRRENNRNSGKRKRNGVSTSEFKGVYFDKSRNKWGASIVVNRKKTMIGRYDREIDAASAYNEKSKILFGEFARLNIL